MPIRASLHFHNTGAIYRLILDNHVSMPIRAFLHFYLKNGVCFHGGNGCVNALLGFPSFLPSTMHQRLSLPVKVSMPFWAFLHFYWPDGRNVRFLLECQCPSGLSFISTRKQKIGKKIRKRCQCPSGLSFISTASFWNPQKQSIFQAFFAGIYLKILKKRFFRLFFVLFTICSYFNTNHSCT